MDVTPLINPDSQIIQSYGGGRFKVSGVYYDGPVIVSRNQTIAWHVTDIDQLTVADFESIVALPDIGLVLLGGGARAVFPPVDIRRHLKQHGIALESMDSGAACRTYNVLMAEGRRVAVAMVPA